MIQICIIIIISSLIRDLRVGLVIELDLNLFLWWMKMKMMILVVVVIPKQLKLIPALIDHRKFHLRRLRRRNRWLQELLIMVHPKKWWRRKMNPMPRALRLILQ